jgi:hypothetical protein
MAKGIMFTEPMFREVISGKKTQTRRIVIPQPDDSGLHDHDKYPMSISPEYDITGFWGNVEESGETKEFKPKYKPGEKLYLKEPYYICPDKILHKYNGAVIGLYEANGIPAKEQKWQNKMFMPAKYARYFIEITGVRAERLQEISDEDCIKEGIDEYKGCYFSPIGCYIAPDYWNIKTPQNAYAALIDKINGKGTFAKNPFVWVYDFKLIKNN